MYFLLAPRKLLFEKKVDDTKLTMEIYQLI